VTEPLPYSPLFAFAGDRRELLLQTSTPPVIPPPWPARFFLPFSRVLYERLPGIQLRWRGRQSGPYPVSEINRMLDDHEIGMGHEIFYQDEWITLEEFFAALQKAAAPQRHTQKTPSHHAVGAAPGPAAREKFPAFASRYPSPQPPSRDWRRAVRVTVWSSPCWRCSPALGAHNFYARQWMTGLLQLLLSVATF
jgi:hypothetical protein